MYVPMYFAFYSGQNVRLGEIMKLNPLLVYKNGFKKNRKMLVKKKKRNSVNT